MGATDPLQPQQRPLPARWESPQLCWVGGRVSLAPRVRPQNACSHAMIQMGFSSLVLVLRYIRKKQASVAASELNHHL